MSQEMEWDREYKKSQLLTKENKPQNDVVRFTDFLEENGLKMDGLKILDIGSGTGRNSLYFAQRGAKVFGIELSRNALEIAEKNTKDAGLEIEYMKGNIGWAFPFEDNSFDILLDVTSSNSLSESERNIYLIESKRVLKEGGYFFVKALCKDGDKNAKTLLKDSPGKEKDTYVLPGLNVTERVWSKNDFVTTYEKYFTILHLEKKTSYPRMNGRSYKRNWWICYMKK